MVLLMMIAVILVFNYLLQGQAVHCFVTSYLDDQSKTAHNGLNQGLNLALIFDDIALEQTSSVSSSYSIAEYDRRNPCL